MYTYELEAPSCAYYPKQGTGQTYSLEPRKNMKFVDNRKWQKPCTNSPSNVYLK